ncbi:MAG: anaerobic ribonucleoside-triphosphate reductase, partial [Treponema sp.]|nr:anaerobic ribonucleoside-triphosphate reductase [Treponema sp.]
MKIIKRNGEEAIFDIRKIETAITKANNAIPESDRLSPEYISAVSSKIAEKCNSSKVQLNVEAIQDLVETELMRIGAFDLAKVYITYRYRHALMRKANSTDKQILSLLECANEEVKQENS